MLLKYCSFTFFREPRLRYQLKDRTVEKGSRCLLFYRALFHNCTHAVAQTKSAVVVKIITHKRSPIQACSDAAFIAGVGQQNQSAQASLDTKCPISRFAIVVLEVFYKPVNSIPGIGAFINSPWLLCMRKRLVNFHVAFAFVFAAYILKIKNSSPLWPYHHSSHQNPRSQNCFHPAHPMSAP